MSIGQVMSGIGEAKNMELSASPSTLIPEVYGDFKQELARMLNSMETGDKYKSPFFAQEVDPNSAAMSVVMSQTCSIFDQMITQLYNSLQTEKKWADMLGNMA